MAVLRPRDLTMIRPHAGRKRTLYTDQGGRKIDENRNNEDCDIKEVVRNLKNIRSWEDQGF